MKYIFIFLLMILFYCNCGAAAFGHFAGHRNLYHTVGDTDSVVKKRSISVGVNYGSDVQFFGRTGPITYPYVSTDAIYNFKSGAFVYGSGVKVLGYNPVFDEVDLGGGYLLKYSNKVSGSISYTRFIFDKDAAPIIKSLSLNDINFKNSFDWKIAKSSIIFDYLFGKENDYFVTLNTSKYIETDWSIFDDKDFLSFNPAVAAILGTQNFVGSYSSIYRSKLGLTDAIISPGPVYKPPLYNNGRFNALNYSIKFPIAYNRPHYTFEASWKYSIPVDVEGELKNKHELFFNMTFIYVFYK